MTSETSWIVDALEDRINVIEPDGSTRFVGLDDLRGVVIETSDSGPFGPDVWWLLFGADEKVACAFPQGASGGKEVVDRLMGLPGFDHEAMIMAMGSTANAVFPVWRDHPPV